MKRLIRFILARLFKRSCLNCAYFLNDHPEFGSGFVFHEYKGFTAECFHERWNRGYEIAPGEYFEETLYKIVDTARGNVNGLTPLTREELQDKLGKDYGDNRIRLKDGAWLDLDKHQCIRYFPANGRGSMTMERCWEEQQKTDDRRRFWIPTGISGFALLIAGLSLWRSWQ